MFLSQSCRLIINYEILPLLSAPTLILILWNFLIICKFSLESLNNLAQLKFFIKDSQSILISMSH